MTSYFTLRILLIFLIIAISSTTGRDTKVKRHSSKSRLNQKLLHNSYTKYICLEDDNDIEKSSTSLGIACKCPSIRAPVCGSDNITYHNRCFMHCRAKHATTRYHRYRLTLKHFGECEIPTNSSNNSITV